MTSRLLAVLLILGLAMAPALTAASAMEEVPGGGHDRHGGMGVEAPFNVTAYVEEAVIGPSEAHGYVEVYVEPQLPVLALLQGYLSPGAAGLTGSLTAYLEERVNASGTISYNESGRVVYDPDRRGGNVASHWSLYLDVDAASYNESSGTLDVYNVSLDLRGMEYAEFQENYTSYTLDVRGPVEYRQSGTNSIYVSFILELQVNLEANATSGAGQLGGHVKLDFNTGNPLADSGYATMVYSIVTTYAEQYGLDQYINASLDAAEGIVTITFNFPFNLTKPPEIPAVPGGVEVEPPRGGPVFAGLTVAVNASYTVSLQASFDGQKLQGSIQAGVDGVPGALLGGVSLNASLAVSPYTTPDGANLTAVRLEVSASNTSDPSAAFYTALKTAIKAFKARKHAENPFDYRVVFKGVDGVKFGFNGPEYDTVVFTAENASRLPELKMYYNDTEYSLGNGTLAVKAKGPKASVTVPAGTHTVTVHGAVKATLHMGPAAALFRLENTTVVVENPMGTFVVHFKGALVQGTAEIETIDPTQAASLLPAGVNAEVVGPALKVKGVVSGGGCVEIPLVKTPENPALIRVLDNGSYQIIEADVEDGKLVACTPGFSTLIPVDAEAGGQPPAGNTTTTTTQATSPRETTTQPPAGSVTTTTTTQQTTTTTQPATTTPPAKTTSTTTTTTTTTTGKTTTTGQTTTTTAGETTGKTTTTGTTTGAAGTAGETTTEQQGGGVSGKLVGALVVVIILAAAAAFLTRR